MKKTLLVSVVALLFAGLKTDASVLNISSGGENREALVNTPNQELGQIHVTTHGRQVAISDIVFHLNTDKPVYNITMSDENGAVVAGPFDAMLTKSGADVRLTDTITFPIGTHAYTIRGTLSMGFENGEMLSIWTVPNLDWHDGQKPYRSVGATGNHVEVRPKSVVSGATITACKGGTLSISTDPSSPAFSVASGGSAGVVIGTYKLRAAAEPVRLYSLGLKLGTNAWPGDIIQATIWDSTGQVGNAIFVGNQHWAVSILNQPLYIPADAEKVLMIRVDLAHIGVAQSGKSGDVVKIDYDDTRPENTLAGGVITGQEVPVTGTTDVAGVRMFKSYPTFALDPLPSTGIAGDGRLLLFKVTASPAGPVTINKMGFRIGGIGAFNDWASLVVYSDSTYSHIVKSYGGLVGLGIINLTNQPVALMYPRVVIPAGSTYYFELLGDCSGVAVTTLLGNDSSGSSSCFDNNDYIMWSPNTTTMSQPWDCDWFNGYGLPGLPSSGITQTRTQ